MVLIILVTCTFAYCSNHNTTAVIPLGLRNMAPNRDFRHNIAILLPDTHNHCKLKSLFNFHLTLKMPKAVPDIQSSNHKIILIRPRELIKPKLKAQLTFKVTLGCSGLCLAEILKSTELKCPQHL